MGAAAPVPIRQVKRVLCFGDSNTWGYAPRTGVRYPKSVRWTGVLQELLGDGYEIIEEGNNGRTAAFDYKARFGKNGRDYLRPCMDSHFPLDVVILSLGTNDTKVEFGLSPEKIAAGFEECVEVALGKGLERPSPGVRLIIGAPPLVVDAHLNGYADMIGSEAKSKKLPALYKKIAEKHKTAFVDLSREVSPSELDGCHLSEASHRKVAERYAAALRTL